MSRRMLLSFVSIMLRWFAFDVALCAQDVPQQSIPPNFSADRTFAANIRQSISTYTRPAVGQYSVAKQVLVQLVKQLPPDTKSFAWDVRIAKGAGNVFVSPDGTIVVDEELAHFMGQNLGFWAAALAHEIVHVVRRDWGRRYLYREQLRNSASAQIDIGVNSGAATWLDSSTAEKLFTDFCRRQEIDADADGMMLMARAGYHPDFMPAFYHLLQAQPLELDPRLLDSVHPAWDDRYEQLRSLFIGAGKEFIRLWPAPYASPGGNPPIVVYAGAPSQRRDESGGLQVVVPLHCDNLYGAVEVVLRLSSTDDRTVREWHQDTGCTSNQTVVTFSLADVGQGTVRGRLHAIVTILDARGGLLTRLLALKQIR